MFQKSHHPSDCFSSCPESHLASQSSIVSSRKQGTPRRAASPNFGLGELVLLPPQPGTVRETGPTGPLSLSDPRVTTKPKIPQAACPPSVLNQVDCWPFISPAGNQQVRHKRLPPQQVPACVVPVSKSGCTGHGEELKLWA